VSRIPWPAAWLRCHVSKRTDAARPTATLKTLFQDTALLVQELDPKPGRVSLHMRTGGSPPVVGALELELSAAPWSQRAMPSSSHTPLPVPGARPVSAAGCCLIILFAHHVCSCRPRGAPRSCTLLGVQGRRHGAPAAAAGRGGAGAGGPI
jgi:hypothetical protein